VSEYDDDFGVYDEAPPFAEELTQLVGPVRLPQTSDEFAAASGTLQNAQQAVAGSPGAVQYFAEASAHGVAVVVDRIEAVAAQMGAGIVADRPAAYTHASELYDACLRAGDSSEEAQRFSLEMAAKKATGTRTYKDVSDEFQKRTFGKTLIVQPRKDFRSR
jgi:hypothetical protein